MKHDLGRIEISPFFLAFSWLDLSSAKWVMIYTVYKSSVVEHILLCLTIPRNRHIPSMPTYDHGVTSI